MYDSVHMLSILFVAARNSEIRNVIHSVFPLDSADRIELTQLAGGTCD